MTPTIDASLTMLATVSADPSPLLRVAGRMHPFFVHFAVAMVPVALLLEVLHIMRRGSGLAAGVRSLLAVGAIAAAAAVSTGWINADLERGDADRAIVDPDAPSAADARRLGWHRWSGVAAGAGVIALALAAAGASPEGRRRSVVRGGMVAMTGLIMWTGHIGGDLVKGAGYVFKPLSAEWSEPNRRTGADSNDGDVASVPVPDPVPAPAATPAPTDPIALAALESRALEVLEMWCLECHGPERQDAGLQLVPLAKAFEWEPEYWTIFPGDPDGSLSMQRMLLPVEDRLHMPRNGPMLSDEELAAIEDWIAAGAPVDGAIQSMDQGIDGDAG